MLEPHGVEIKNVERHDFGGCFTPTTLKIGAKVTRHSKYVFFQLAEVAVPRRLFAAILDRIARLAIPPPRVT
jgi:hypothetical protein